ncbi:MAG: pyruvate kinase, partial [Firmicutes bacterium]|nr:pyruvate kinase [Bacillota bacterium]
VAEIADQLGASAIVSSTESGYTPRMVAKYRPKVPIVAATPSPVTFRQLGVVWGVFPVLVHQTHSTDEMFDMALHAAMENGYIAPGDLVVLTAGVPIGHAGTTNLLEVQIAGEVLAQGTGVGKKAAHGPVFTWRPGEDPERFPSGAVLVVDSLTEENASLTKRACAIIAEEGGLSSPAVVGGISAGIPVVVGVHRATQLLSDGDEVTVDPVRGFVYKGRARAR